MLKKIIVIRFIKSAVLEKGTASVDFPFDLCKFKWGLTINASDKHIPCIVSY